VLDFYSFNIDKWLVIPILCAFMLGTNVVVYLGLLPPRSKVKMEEPTLPADSPTKRAVVEMEPSFTSPSVLKARRDPFLTSFTAPIAACHR
jgi:hypothetical protein